MRIFGIEIRKAQSGLANPQKWLTDIFAGDLTESGIAVTSDTAMRASAVWGCVKILSESIATLPLILYQRDGDSKSRATNHRLYTLLHDSPNPEMTAYTFKQIMMVNLLLRGNAYAEIEFDRIGRVIGLWPLSYEYFYIEPSRDGNGKIIYKVRDVNLSNEVIVPSNKMFHIMGLGRNGYVGLSPIQQARQSIGLSLAAEEFGARFFGSGANMKGVLQHPGKLNKEAQERLRETWEKVYGGLAKSHKTAILEEGMTYNRIGIPPEDAQFLETRKFQVTDINRIFRVPPHMNGDLDRATWANIEHQAIEFVVHTLGPWFENWEQTISWKLLTPQERSTYYAEFLADAFLRGDTQSRYTSYATGRQNGWLSANEIRKLENMEPIEGGDIYLIPLNMVPADQAGSRPPKPTDTQGGPTSTRAIENIEYRATTNGPDERRRLAEIYHPIFRDALDRIFRREQADIMRQVRKRSTRSEVLVNWVEDYYKEHPIFAARTLMPILESYADAVGKTTELDVESVWPRLNDDSRVFINSYADNFGLRESISSRMRVTGTIRTAMAEEKDIAESLETMFDLWSTDRLDGDVTHETNQAANAVAKYAFMLAGVQVLKWKSSSNSCPICLSMEGKTVGITQMFVNTGQVINPEDDETQPLTVSRDLGHPPLHGGCVCQIVPG